MTKKSFLSHLFFNINDILFYNFFLNLLYTYLTFMHTFMYLADYFIQINLQ